MRQLVQRWSEYRPTVKRVFGIALGSSALTLLVGFGLGGWVTGGTARQMAEQAAAASHDQLAAAVCAEQFLRAADAGQRLKKLQSLLWWERDDRIAADGWATMPGETAASAEVAEMCATSLAKHADTAAKATPVSGVPR